MMMVSEAERNFMALTDEMVLLAEDDPELGEAIRYIDEQAYENGISFYDMMLIVINTTSDDEGEGVEYDNTV